MSSAYVKKKIQKRNKMDNDSLKKRKFLKNDRRYVLHEVFDFPYLF